METEKQYWNRLMQEMGTTEVEFFQKRELNEEELKQQLEHDNSKASKTIEFYL